jgi:thiol-disulfide isomerase/thioredoxin
MKRCLILSYAVVLTTWLSGCDRSTPQPLTESSAAASAAAGAPLAPSGSQTRMPTSADVGAPPSLDADSNALAGAPTALPDLQPTGADSDNLSNASPPRVELENRPFATLQPLASQEPAALIDHLRQIDAALQDLVLAGTSNFLDEQSFTAAGLRLGRMKQAAGQQLARSPQSDAEQRKAGILAELVALSHMSGLRDIKAAQELERFANELATSGDVDLAHQARVVLIGFELQALQNGLHQQPDALLAQVAELFQRPQDRGFPEFMVLQQAHQVLSQMGFSAAAQQVLQSVFTAYRTSPDAQLRGEAWLLEVQSSQAYQNFLQAFRSLGSETFDTATALVAVRGLLDAFPSMQTVEQIATTIANIEYSGYIPLSQDVAQLTRDALSAFPDADPAYVEKSLQDHATRTSLMNAPLPLAGLVSFDGRPLDWNEYAGKVVLVDFWASWCLKCLREIPGIRQVQADLAPQGFAVLSINMDENLASARDFVQTQNFPWRSYHSDDPQRLGFQSVVARQMGVNAIPLMLLLDRQGRVAAMHVRGEQLRPAIEKLLGATPPTELPATPPTE